MASLKNVLVTIPNLQSSHKCVSHDKDFFFTDERVAQGNYEPEVVEACRAESPV